MFTLGQSLMRSGNFTMLGFVDSWGAADLERRVGFHAGRLSQGFAIIALTSGQRLAPHELELQGSSRWSGGFVTDSEGRVELEGLLLSRGQDVQRLKEKVCDFFGRGGARTPAKVVPFAEHLPGMQYPDAEAIAPGIRSGVPQFNLLVPKAFSVVKVHGPAEA